MKKPKVTIYSLPRCPFCQQTKAYFRHHKIKYEDVDVLTNPSAQAEMIAKSGQTSTPVIEMNGRVLVGFQKDVLDSLLSLK
jgi:glutaredoxin-like YruB-family protein